MITIEEIGLDQGHDQEETDHDQEAITEEDVD